MNKGTISYLSVILPLSEWDTAITRAGNFKEGAAVVDKAQIAGYLSIPILMDDHEISLAPLFVRG